MKISDSVKNIPAHAFEHYGNFTFEFPSHLESIGEFAFQGCTIASISLPETLKSIGQGAFNVGGLKNVFYEGSKSSWAKIKIGSDNEPLLNTKIKYGKVGVEKKKQTISVQYATEVLVSKVKTAKQKVKIATDAKGTVTFTSVSYANAKSKQYMGISKTGTVTIGKGAPAGIYTAKVTISAAGNDTYQAAKTTKTIKIAVVKKLSNPIVIPALSKTIKAKSVKSKGTSFSIKGKAKTSISYQPLKFGGSSAKKYIGLSKSGKITVKKGAPRGTYTIKFKATAKGTAAYKTSSVTKTFKIKLT